MVASVRPRPLGCRESLIWISLLLDVVRLQVTRFVAITFLIILLVKSTPLALSVCATVIVVFPTISNTMIGA